MPTQKEGHGTKGETFQEPIYGEFIFVSDITNPIKQLNP